MTKQKTILVTGGGGYIGRHVVTRLLDLGHRVWVNDLKFDGLDERAEQSSVPIFSGDEAIYAKLNKPDICVHLAWRNGFIHNHASHMADLSNHFVFLNNMISGGLESLTVMGTMHEIGYWEGEIDESAPANPLSFYGTAKNSLRQALKILAAQKKITFHWLRGYYITGDDSNSSSLFAKIMKWEAEGQTSFPFTSGKNRYDFIDVKDLAWMIALASIQTKVTGEINCCSGVPVSLADRVMQFLADNELKIKPAFGEFPDRPYDSPGVWGNAQKINAILSDYALQPQMFTCPESST